MNIIWTPLAKETYAQLLRHLTENYPLDLALELDEKVEVLIDRLTRFRFFCPPSETRPPLRRCVISRFTSMVYQVEGDGIWIYGFFDNRMGQPQFF